MVLPKVVPDFISKLLFNLYKAPASKFIEWNEFKITNYEKN